MGLLQSLADWRLFRTQNGKKPAVIRPIAIVVALVMSVSAAHAQPKPKQREFSRVVSQLESIMPDLMSHCLKSMIWGRTSAQAAIDGLDRDSMMRMVDKMGEINSHDPEARIIAYVLLDQIVDWHDYAMKDSPKHYIGWSETYALLFCAKFQYPDQTFKEVVK